MLFIAATLPIYYASPPALANKFHLLHLSLSLKEAGE